MYSSSSLEGKTEEWEVTGRVRTTLSQPAVDIQLCDLLTGRECLATAKVEAKNKNGEH